jgi:hypothetical protein
LVLLQEEGIVIRWIWGCGEDLGRWRGKGIRKM